MIVRPQGLVTHVRTLPPSAVQATAQGLAAPSSKLSSSTVLTISIRATSMRVSAAVFIQPRSSCVVGT